MKKREIWIEPIMGMGRLYGYYLWRQTDAGNDEMIGKFQKRKWAEVTKAQIRLDDENPFDVKPERKHNTEEL
jgi:hypothetical protein